MRKDVAVREGGEGGMQEGAAGVRGAAYGVRKAHLVRLLGWPLGVEHCPDGAGRWGRRERRL